MIDAPPVSPAPADELPLDEWEREATSIINNRREAHITEHDVDVANRELALIATVRKQREMIERLELEKKLSDNGWDQSLISCSQYKARAEAAECANGALTARVGELEAGLEIFARQDVDAMSSPDELDLQKGDFLRARALLARDREGETC